jgi:ABC-type branched-subunit amino acid transport system ATPase component
MTNDGMVLRTEHLFKKYGKRTVVNDVSIDVKQGEIVGLLGPNGAGKTTTFYMTTGLVTPNSGRIFLNDEEITKFPVYKLAQKGIGYLAQEASVFRKMTVEDNIKSVLEMTSFTKEYQKNYKRMTSVIVGIYRKGRKKAFLVLVRGEDEQRYIERVEELYRVMRARLERLREHRHSLCLLISGQSTTEGARAAVAHRSKMLMVREHFQFMHRRRAKMNRLLDSDFYILKD